MTLASVGRCSTTSISEMTLSVVTNFLAKTAFAMSRTLASKRKLELHTLMRLTL
jgi:hypothetical protein